MRIPEFSEARRKEIMRYLVDTSRMNYFLLKDNFYSDSSKNLDSTSLHFRRIFKPRDYPKNCTARES